MQRRNAIATAGAVTATATAAVVALGANFGIFGLAQQDSNVGRFPAVEATSTAPATPSPSQVDPSARSRHDDDHIPQRGHDRGSDHDDD
jgi:hypothetical protein